MRDEIKNRVHAKINYLKSKLNKLIITRDTANRIISELENNGDNHGISHTLASMDCFHMVDEIKTLSNVINNLEELLRTRGL